MSDKLIVIPNNLDQIKSFSSYGITFLCGMDNYSIGYKSFSYQELNKLNVKKYLLINKIMTTKQINELESDISKYQDIIGIFFEDVGVYEKLKTFNYEFISYQTHFNTNISSINYALNNHFNSLVIANDLTLDEISIINKSVCSPVVIFLYGLSPVMYSRRLLVSNYNEYYHTDIKNPIINEDASSKKFKLHEDSEGTMVFDNNYYDGTPLINVCLADKIKYYLVNLIDLDNVEAHMVIQFLIAGNYDKLHAIKGNTNHGFLYQETIYCLKEDL